MKIDFTPNYEDYYTISQVKQMKQMIKNFKEDYAKETAKDAAKSLAFFAAREKCDYLNDVLKVEYEACIDNNTMYEFFGDDTGRADILVHVIASTDQGFITAYGLMSNILRADEGHIENISVRHYTSETF